MSIPLSTINGIDRKYSDCPLQPIESLLSLFNNNNDTETSESERSMNSHECPQSSMESEVWAESRQLNQEYSNLDAGCEFGKESIFEDLKSHDCHEMDDDVLNLTDVDSIRLVEQDSKDVSLSPNDSTNDLSLQINRELLTDPILYYQFLPSYLTTFDFKQTKSVTFSPETVFKERDHNSPFWSRIENDRQRRRARRQLTLQSQQRYSGSPPPRLANRAGVPTNGSRGSIFWKSWSTIFACFLPQK